ncbi:MAG: helix-turn-helix domain-containing protein [Patescibacteria group bacterium]|nr:helix-turn-helix domain-containing protein [Patescibacteria group bacterium]MCL5431990.1 helix-turn-helix domain-containing protein [Patescibacteria group bacterium]
MPRKNNRTLEKLGTKIRKLRKNTKLTQEELAGDLDISRVYMGYIEQGRESPSLKLLMKMARKFKVKVEDLFHR